jgi:hypothetical protein
MSPKREIPHMFGHCVFASHPLDQSSKALKEVDLNLFFSQLPITRTGVALADMREQPVAQSSFALKVWQREALEEFEVKANLS